MGQLIGISLNVALQFIVIRYLFVYHILNGDKSKYEEQKVGYNILFIFIGLLLYPVLYLIGEAYPIFAIIILLVLIDSSIIMHQKWKNDNIIPNPLLNKSIIPNEANTTNNEISQNHQKTITEKEKLFMQILQNNGISSAISAYHEFKKDNPSQQLFQSKTLYEYGYQTLKLGNLDDAKNIFELNLLAYPKSSNCNASLADIYFLKKEYELAKKYYQYAIKYLVSDNELTAEFKEVLLKDINVKLVKIQTSSSN